MPETKPTLPPALDPRSQAVEPGSETSEYRLNRLLAVGTLLGSFGLASLALLALILGKLDLTGTLVLLGVLLAPSVPSAAYMARGYSKDRADTKIATAKGAADIAVADVRGSAAVAVAEAAPEAATQTNIIQAPPGAGGS